MRTKTSGALLAIFSLSLVRCDCGGGLLDIQPNIDAEPNPLAFPRAYLGLTTQEALTVRNTGQAPLVVGGVRIKEGSHPGLFVEPNGFELQPGQSTILNVRLATDQLGPISGALLLDSNDPDTPTLEVPIQAEGQRRPGPAIGVCHRAAGRAARVCRSAEDRLWDRALWSDARSDDHHQQRGQRGARRDQRAGGWSASVHHL